MTTMQQDYQYYLDNQDELAKKYAGKYIVIKDKAVEAVYDSEIEAYEEAKSKYSLGTFLIKPCLPKDSDTPQVLHTLAHF